MRWYDVKMSGRYNGEPCEVDETVQAGDQETAVQYALMEKFGVGFSADIGCEYAEMDGSGLRPLVFTLGERGRLVTDHERLSDVVAEADPVRVAKLVGAPELLLDMGEDESLQAATAAPYAPDTYQRQVLATWGGGDNLMAALLGVVGEAGELADLHKKYFFKPGHEASREAVLDEAADVAYYLAVLAHLWGFTFDDMFAHLAVKLAGGHGWVKPSNSTGLEANRE